MKHPTVLFKLGPNGHIPTKAHKSDAGWDFYSAEDKVVPAWGRALIKTDVYMAFSPEYYGRIAPRSGLALKSGIDVFAGVIDSSWRDNTGIILFNSTNEDFYVKTGNKIAQIIFEKHAHDMVAILVDNLPDSDRDGGFGSTGL